MGVEILAHFYQRAEVKALADFVGGSLGIYRAALRSEAKAIMVCGVDFLTQTLERLRPDLVILTPRLDADCPFSRTVGPGEVALARQNRPDTLLAADIKASGEVRDLCDLEIGTFGEFHPEILSQSLPNRHITVLPALSAGDPTALPHGQWPGAACQVHLQVTAADVEAALKSLPGARVAANSLCRPEVRRLAEAVGDSQTIFEACQRAPKGDWLVICESGLVETLRQTLPESRFFETEVEIFCPNMKLTNIKDMLRCLEAEFPAVGTSTEIPALAGTAGQGAR
jgi:quinolinate synthase